MSDKIVLDPEGKLAANCNVYEKVADECRTTIEIAKGFTTDKISDNCEVTGEVPNPPKPSTHDAVLRYSYAENPNYMRQVAQILRVKFDEKFKVCDKYGKIIYVNLDSMYTVPLEFVINSKGLWEVDGVFKNPNGENLHKLLDGEWNIVRQPWRPENGDRVWLVDPYGNISDIYYYSNKALPLLALRNNLLFRTKKEARQNKSKVKEFWNKVKEEIEVGEQS